MTDHHCFPLEAPNPGFTGQLRVNSIRWSTASAHMGTKSTRDQSYGTHNQPDVPSLSADAVAPVESFRERFRTETEPRFPDILRNRSIFTVSASQPHCEHAIYAAAATGNAINCQERLLIGGRCHLSLGNTESPEQLNSLCQRARLTQRLEEVHWVKELESPLWGSFEYPAADPL